MYPKEMKKLTELSKEEIETFLNSFDTVLSDCDGVLYLEDSVISGSEKVLNKFREMGKKVFYVTNNSSKMRDDYVMKLKRLDFIAKKEEILSTAYLTANYLKERGFNKTTYLIGSKGLAQEFDLVGLKYIGLGPDVLQTSVSNTLQNLSLDPEVGAVVVGFDEHISYPKMIKAASYLSNPDCLFIGTNTDERLPVDKNVVIPGTGTIVRSIETCAERKPVIMGKPHETIRNVLIKQHGVNPGRTLMIGDKCNTDILLGAKCGFKTILVLSGVTDYKEVCGYQKSPNKEEQDLVPDFIMEKLGDLLPHLK